MEALYYIGFIFVLGALVEWLSPKLYIPRVVGYLLLGLIIGPDILAIIPSEFVQNSHIITEIALSIIAVLIGSTLKLSVLKGHEKEVMLITLFQSISAFIIVAVGFIVVGTIFAFEEGSILLIAILLGGIATATAPATPMAIVKELRAKGNFTSTFLAVVALDDAVALIMFSLALTIGVAFVGNGSVAWINIIEAMSVIGFSVVLGAVFAVTNSMLDRLLHHKGMETIATLGLIFVLYSLSEYWGLEPLLSAMAMGIVMTNISKDFDIVEEEIDSHLSEIIFMLFFIMSAMHLKLETLFVIPLLIVFYIIFRFFGKVFGSYIGAVLSKSSGEVKKYMGIALIPQAGVAIGLALSLQTHEGLEIIAPTILNVVIATTLVHELIGPFMTRYAIKKSGESQED